MPRPAFLLAALLLLAPARSWPAEYVTSDTVGYCDALAQRMDGYADMPPDARLLLVEGRAMCERGHVASGLRRLRLAMLMMQGRAGP